jgi:DNA replication protein DnaC
MARYFFMRSSNLHNFTDATIFQDKRTAIAAVDRLVHHANILELQVESYRRKQALERKGII